MQSAGELFENADRLETHGDLHGALRLWRELARRNPDPGVFCRLASVAQDLGYAEEAEGAFARAIELDPSMSLPWLGLGSLAIDNGAYHEAEKHLKAALLLEETRAGLSMLGVALAQSGKPKEAEEAYLRALEVDPNFEEAHFNLGVLLRSSNPPRAAELFKAALRLDPGYAEAHRELGWLLRKEGHLPEAEHHLRRSIELKPDDPWTHVYLGNLLWHQGDKSKAINAYKWAREAAPDRAFPLWSLANLYEDEEELGIAESLYKQALDLEPTDSVANMNYGRMLLKKGDLPAARFYLNRALLLNPDFATAKKLLRSLDQGS